MRHKGKAAVKHQAQKSSRLSARDSLTFEKKVRIWMEASYLQKCMTTVLLVENMKPLVSDQEVILFIHSCSLRSVTAMLEALEVMERSST